MKRIYTLILLVFVSASLFAQSLSGYKICVDPGHGGNDPANDRWIPEAGFWESEGNYGKGVHLKQILEDLGAEVFITRTGNSNSNDLPLSQRAGIANANNVDFFHSIHSNATGTANRANFPLMLFRGYDNSPVFPESKTYGQIVNRKILDARSGTWSSTNINVRGDWSFYPSWGTSGLGVLRPLNMPGLLSEGSFHDYIPEAKRLRNDLYLKHEAWAIARAMLEFYSAGNFTTGIVAGIIRDQVETVPSSYQAVTTADTKKPLNAVRAKLLPNNLEYTGDDFDNGYFMFDNLEPGSYQLVIEANDYKADTVDVNIIAHRSVFANKNLELVPNFNAPTIIISLPNNQSDEVSTLIEVVVEFDIRMNRQITQNAFTIEPQTDGEFRWENDSRRMIFTPDSPLLPGTEYTVTLSDEAKTYFDVNLSEQYSFSFTTRSKLNIVSAYPTDGETEVSITVLVQIQFEEAIQSNSLPGNILFYDENNSFVNVIVNTGAYVNGLIEFYPRDPLAAGKTYRVILKEGISDIGNVPLNEERTIEFVTDNSIYTDGSIIDDFETIGSWKQPNEAETTFGIDEAVTKFNISTSVVRTDAGAGELKYTFTDDFGRLVLENSSPIPISGSASDFGIWVFGDNSSNFIEYKFVDNINTEYSVLIDTLDWTGWKLKGVDIGAISSGGDLAFQAITVRNNSQTTESGTIYFDDMQIDFITPVENEDDHLPAEFSLVQNYPNPFNPTTTIQYTIPMVALSEVEGQHTMLRIYDILGSEVTTLVNTTQKPGTYKIEFDASPLPSGVYFYRMDAGQFSNVKKMVLLK